MYALWKCITNDAGFYFLVLFGGATIGGVVAFLLKPKPSLLKTATFGGVFAVVLSPMFWWYLANLVDTKRGLPEPISFAFVKDWRSDSVTCASATEGALVIQVELCGVTETAIQNGMLSELLSNHTYRGPKPVVVTFRQTPKKTEVFNSDGSRTTWLKAGAVLREELLTTQSDSSELRVGEG